MDKSSPSNRKKKTLFEEDDDEECNKKKGLFEHDESYDNLETVHLEALAAKKKQLTQLQGQLSTVTAQYEALYQQHSTDSEKWHKNQITLQEKVKRRDKKLDAAKHKVLELTAALEKQQPSIEQATLIKQLQTENQKLTSRLTEVLSQLAVAEFKNQELEKKLLESSTTNSSSSPNNSTTSHHHHTEKRGIFSKFKKNLHVDTSPPPVSGANRRSDGVIRSPVIIIPDTTENHDESSEEDTSDSEEGLTNAETLFGPAAAAPPPPLPSPPPPPVPITNSNTDPDSYDHEEPPNVSRMNEYMEARRKEQLDKEKREATQRREKQQQKDAYEKEWEVLAKEEKERKVAARRKSRKGGGSGGSGSSSSTSRSKHVRKARLAQRSRLERVSATPRGSTTTAEQPRARSTNVVPPPPTTTAQSNSSSDSSDSSEDDDMVLPPEPSEADLELFRRTQERLRELHASEQQKRSEAEEADAVASKIKERLTLWARGKTIVEMLATVNEFSSLVTLSTSTSIKTPEDVRREYRSLIRKIHPDKLKSDTSVPERLEAQELFSVITHAYDTYKSESIIE